MSDNKTPCQATTAATLREQIMDSRIPKNEREWWAARTIEKLERELAEASKMLYRLARPFFPSEGATIEDENTRLRAEIELLRKDGARLDWLADPKNTIGNVTLPRQHIMDHPDSMRAALDAAMAEPK
jgi:hypothetical protein